MELFHKTTLIYFSMGLFIATAMLYQSCQKEDLISPDDTTLVFQKLSDYNIYQGNPSELVPTNDYKLYELSSQLFTDYAEKQRLIKVPTGTKMVATDNGFLSFPEGTIIVKTFYYFNNKQNPYNGRKLIETRILELKNGKWVVGTYMWNNEQTDAYLISSGLNKTVNWIDEEGKSKVISYRIPSNLDCKTCHNSNKSVTPIGPKVRNLNFEIHRNAQTLNQLTYLQNEGLLEPINPLAFTTMPNYNNTSVSLENRARAYLDINCAHCHKKDGFAAQFRYRMEYETDLNASKIREGKTAIEYMMSRGDMPKIGTTVIDKNGLELIKQYLKTL